jgi:ZIP family zinc transporter
MLFLVGILASAVTFLGGVFALRFKDKLHLILGFSAGTVLGVAFFDLIPESFELVQGKEASLFIVLGIIGYMILDRTFLKHGHSHEEEDHAHVVESKNRGVMRAVSFAVHSLLDGMAIGLSFQVSFSLGLVVTLAVLAHDFSDGINTVSAVLKSNHSKNEIYFWLFMDAIAPLLGILIATQITVQEQVLGIILSLFAGFFVYIGASDLIPESFHNHPTRLTTIATIIGVVFIGVIVTLAH